MAPPLKRPTAKGFNIAEHLKKSSDNERSRDSVTSDVQKLLQDISSVMRSISPALEPASLESPPLSPPTTTPMPTTTTTAPAAEQGEVGRVQERWGVNSSKHQGRRAQLRSKVAANFNLPMEEIEREASTEGALPAAPLEHDEGVRLGKKAPRKHSTTNQSTPKVPHLNVGDTTKHNKRTTVPSNSVALSKDNASPNDNVVDPNDSVRTEGQDLSEGEGNIPTPSVPPDTTTGEKQGTSSESGVFQASEVRCLLEERKAVLSQSRLQELERAQSEVEAREKKRLERESRRAAKMKADRMAAIADLKRRREEKRAQQEKLAQEEMAFLEASGKVRRPGAQVKRSERHSPAKKPPDPHKEQKVTSPAKEQALQVFFEAGNVKPPPLPPPTSESPPPPIQPAPPIHPALPSKSATTSTYQDIMDTLRLLEEVPPSLEPIAPPLKHGRGAEMGSGALSESKLQSILSYLDQVEKVEVERSHKLAKSVTPSKDSITQPPPSSMPSHKPSAECDLEAASATANDVTATILAQRMELDSKAKTVDMLQKALNQQRELTVYHAKEMEKEGQKRIELQRVEYETTIQRHQVFIDQLIEDKKVLSDRCEQVVKELRELDKKYKAKLASLEESHAAELSKLKQVSAAADKMRREKWRAEETQRIKEATVKGLEPEIQRIIARGKAELQKQKALHEAELLQADERASKRFVAQMEELREQCALEKEQACAHERELARQRYEKMAEQEEVNYQQQRRRLFGEVAQEKDKLADQFLKQKANLDLQIKENAELHERQMGELKVMHEQEVEELKLRQRSELRNKEDRFASDRQAWEENLLRSQQADFMTREREMRAKLREERDKEIEMVISKLEEETASSKEETERAAESRVRRIREKYEAELKEIERSERATLQKFNTMKSQVVELEGEVSGLRAELRLRDEEVERIGRVASKLTQERDNVSEVVRQEFADR